MRRPSSVDAITTDHPQSAVYVAGRREYMEQVGTLVSQRDQWRLMAIGAMATAFVAVGGAVWDHTKNHAVPYVVETDHLGDAIAVSRLNTAPPINARLIRHQLGRWIVDARSVSIDTGMQSLAIKELYSMIDKNGPAKTYMNEWYSANSPYEKAKTETVSVAVKSVSPLTATTWQVQWVEDHRTRQGLQLPPENWQALITISVNPPQDDAMIMINPTGLYVESITWSQVRV